MTANAICWIYLGGTAWKILLLGIKLFCLSRYKAETFSICLNFFFMKPDKISTHLAHSDNCLFILYWLSDWVEILQSFTKFDFKLNLKVSAFYFEKQKSFISKKKIFRPLSISKKLCLLTQFSRRFWFTLQIWKGC